jgi:hypothetical protein
LNLREKKKQENGENYIMRVFTIGTLHQTLMRPQNQDGEMYGACRKHGGDRIA